MVFPQFVIAIGLEPHQYLSVQLEAAYLILPAGCGIARVVVQILIQKCKPSQYFCLFDDVFWGSRILSFLKPNLPKPKRQRKIRRRFCPGLSSTFMRPVSSRLAQLFCTS